LYNFIIQWFSPIETITIYTSGSTGKPKEIQLLKTDMIKSAIRSNTFFELKPFNNVLLCLPVKYIAGLLMVIRAFEGKMNLLTISPQNIVLNSLDGPINFAALVPIQVDKLISKPLKISKIEKIIIGGAPVSKSLSKLIVKNYKGKAYETYGMTETITHIAIKEINSNFENNTFNAVPNVHFSIDERNCLIINDSLIQPKPLITNDHVELISETSFKLLGRYDNIINTGGIKVQPELIEEKLSNYINGKFCISSIPDDTLGQLVVLVVEKTINNASIDNAFASLSNYQRPKKIIEIEKIPLLSNGKIDRIKLRHIIQIQNT
jgi:o-succinylbenzoate---CoA ligase